MQTTILLVEDDAVLRRGLTELFTREGYRVIEAASMREAKGKLNSEDAWETIDTVTGDTRLPASNYRATEYPLEQNTRVYKYFRFEYTIKQRGLLDYFRFVFSLISGFSHY